MRVSKGIYYFPNYTDARDYADARHWPTDRIIAYGLGWAIQKCVSGDYYGPKDEV